MEEQLINYLLENNYITEEDIEKAKNIQKNYEGNIGLILLNLGVLDEYKLLEALSEILNIELLKKENLDINKVELEDFILRIMMDNNILPFCKEKNSLCVAVDYNLDYSVILQLKSILSYNIKLYLASQDLIEEIKLLYEVEKMDEIDEDIDEEIEKLKEIASEAPVIKLINYHFNKAASLNASDIHYESLIKNMRIRYRIDGILKTFETVPENLKKAVIARLKLISKMNIAENRLPQDGRISLKINNKTIDVRASSIPTAEGESFVLRLLGNQMLNYNINSLDFYDDHKELLKKIISYPNGIFLTTGPTGSGKTTTLYSLLNELNDDVRKIITVEDPVEYKLEGINQIQVKSDIGFTFANALRSILRQDPDIIMIGEIRDLETATIAIQSSLTGHFVLSTLHTNSALGAISRLLDIGVEFFLLKSSIKGLMAQRLVRKLCDNCKETYTLDTKTIKELKLDDLWKKYNISSISTCKAKGCEKCSYTGYKGRLPIAEIVEFNEELQSFFEKDKNFNDLSKLGVRNLFEDGLLKFLEGKTSLNEVLRIAKI